jgi:hypothetical protein
MKLHRRNLLVWGGVALWAVLQSGTVVVAQHAHSDIELLDDAGQVGVEPRIAEGEFGLGLNPAYRAKDPGLESDPAELALHGESPLPGGALVGFDLPTFTIGSTTKSLFYWNGTGAVDFETLASPHELKISDATESFSLQVDGTGAAAGFNFALTADGSGPDPAGFLHQHLLFDLVDASGTGVAAPTAGVYAFATTFRVAGLEDSEPVFWMLASGVDESAHEAAVEFIALSQGIVPEPGTLSLMGVALAAGLLARSDRQPTNLAG